MKLKVYLTIVIRIILMGAFGILMSYFPEHLREFFGDVRDGTDISPFDNGWDWGTRHYWWAWMVFLISIATLVDSIITVIKTIETEYKIKI